MLIDEEAKNRDSKARLKHVVQNTPKTEQMSSDASCPEKHTF